MGSIATVEPNARLTLRTTVGARHGVRKSSWPAPGALLYSLTARAFGPRAGEVSADRQLTDPSRLDLNGGTVR